MAKEQRPQDLGAEPRLTVKFRANAPEKSLEPAQQKAKPHPLSRKLAPNEEVVVSDSEPPAQALQSQVAEATAPLATEASAQASAALFDRSLEAITHALNPLGTASAAADESWLSNGFQMLAQATAGAVTSGASGSAAATTAATTTAAGAGAAGVGAATAAAAGAVSVGAAVAATVAVAAVAANSSKEEIKDTTPPSAPTLALASDTNITTDGITNNGTVNVSGLESGATWQYSTDAGTTWKSGSGSSLILTAGTYAANAIKVRQSDAAGNVSQVASLATAVTVDTTAPATPALALTTDTNITTDGITSNGSVTVSGLETDTTWQYSIDGGTTWSTGSGTSFTLGSGTYAANTVKVRQTDVAGNVSSAGVNTSTLTVDTSASAPSIALASDTNITTDGITSNGSITVTGLEAGATWQYSTDGGTNWTNGSGTSFTLGAGTYAANAVKVKQTDVAGNLSAVAGNTSAITVDTTAPDAPTVSLQGSTATDVTFSSTLPAGVQAGDTVQLYIGGVALGAAVTVNSTQVTAGSVAVTVSKTLLGSAGVKSIQSEVTDIAGNHSNKSTALSITYQPDNSVSDGYIQGAQVYLDINRDGLIDPAVDQLVGTTDATGNFSALLTADQMTYDLLAQGGTDVSTGLPYLGMLKAPAGSTVLNPLTTLVQAVASQAGATDQAGRDQAVAAAKLTVQQALNLPAADLTKVDLLKVSLGAATSNAVSASEAVDVQAKAVMVANLIKTGASAMAGAATTAANATDAATQFNSLSNFVIQGLVQNLKSAAETGQTVQLSDSSSIGNVLNSALTTAAKAGTVVLDTSKATDALNATSMALANVNEFITAAAGSAANGGNVAQALTQVVQAQVVAQRDVATALQSTSGNLATVTALSNVADVRSAATGVNTNNLVLAQNVTAQLANTVDTIAPTVVAVGAKTNAPTVYREGDVLMIGINFSEGVLVNKPMDGWVNALGVPNLGTPTLTFSIAGQDRIAVYDPSQSSGSVLRFVYKIKGADVTATAGGISFASTTLGGSPLITDVAGNALANTDLPAASLQLPTNWSVPALTFANSNTDNVAPTVVVTNNAPANNAPASGDVTFTFTFSESVKGFTVEDIDVVNGIKGKFTMDMDSKVFTLVVKPNTGFAGQMSVQVKANQLYDLAGNAMTTVANSAVNVDTQPPTVRVESSTLDLSPVQNAAQVKFVLSDVPTNGTAFTVEDLVVTGGALSNFAGAGTTYTATLTLTSGATAANIGVKPGAFADAQGMLSMGAGINFNVQQAANFRTLTQGFVTVGSGQTFAFSNGGTAQDTSDDKQGVYTLQANDKVTVLAVVKAGQTSLPSNVQTLLDAIANASSATAFATAITNARAVMDLQFGVKLGDNVDITGDSAADKGAVASLLYTPPTGSNVVFAADAASAQAAAVQPVNLTQTFVKVTAGKTVAYSNNGTPLNASDDKQGIYTLTGNEIVTVNVAPKPSQALPGNAQVLLNAIKNATDVTAFAAAVANARALMEVNFGISLGDSIDITGDKLADKGAGAALLYVAPGNNAISIDLIGDAGVVATSAVQPTLLSQSFLKVSAGKTFAFANNGTPTNSGDDVQGTYTLTSADKVTVVLTPRAGEAMPVDAALLLSAIKNATSVSAFAAAVAAARAKMEVNFGVNLGDGVDITGDGLADKGAGASLVYSTPAANATQIDFAADTGAATAVGVQPVVLNQPFVTVGTGKTFAYSNNATPSNTSDDKQGTFILTGTERISAMASPKAGETNLPGNAQTLLNDIKNATTVTAFAAAVTAAKAQMEVNFGVNLGDGVDITGDGLADKGSGASLVYIAPANNATQVSFSADSGAAASVAVQPVVLTQSFVKVGAGQTFAYSNNGTPGNTSDDKQGVYNLTGTEKVTVMASPKSGDTSLPNNAQTLLNAIKGAATLDQLVAAVTAAKAVMGVNFSVNLGDGVDITGDGLADKGATASVVGTAPAAGAVQVTFAPDSGSTTAMGVQPVLLSQAFVRVSTGPTFAYANNGTPANTSDDKQGVYTLTGTEKVTVVVSPKSGETSMPSTAQTLLNAIKNADTVTAFAAAVTAAKAAMDVYFNVNLGDGADITGDGLADKGAGVSVVYSAPSNTATQVVFAPDTGAATSVGVQPVVLTQPFVTVGTGKTFAYSSNGTPTNTSDDKQGVYTLTGNEKVTVMASPKSGDAALPDNAQTLLNDIKNATTVTAFTTAVTAAKLMMEVNFGVSLGDGTDITGDGLADKGSGASLIYSAPANNATQVAFMPDVGAATSVGVQPVVLTQTFVKVGTGQTFAFSNNGTPTNTGDDKQGVYTLSGTEKVTVMASPKSGETSLPTTAQTLLNAIKNATTLEQFVSAVNAAKAVMEVNYAVSLGDGVDITGDGLADKGSGASLVWNAPTSGATQITFLADAGAATSVGVQPVVLTQNFVKVGTGQTFAYSNNGTPANSTDDKQGVYTLTGTEKVSVMASPKSGDANLPANAQTLLNDIKNATTVTAFAAAVAAAKALMDVNFGVNLGDGADITGDALADKGSGASVVYSAPANGATQIAFAADAGAATSVGVQPVVLSQSFVKVGTGNTFAFANNATPTNTSDDKQGVYTLSGTEKVTVMAAPKSGETGLPNTAQTLLDAIKGATTLDAFVTAVNAAKAVMEINFGVNLGDSVDITGDGLADKGAGASLFYSAPMTGATQITLTPDTSSAATSGVQPVVLTQSFVKVGQGQTFAFSNNGTPANTSDDKQGSYTLTGTEKVTVMAAPKLGESTLPANAQTLLNAIKSATTMEAFLVAVSAARAVMEITAGVSLGDGVDITGDGLADKGAGAALVINIPAAGATQITFAPDTGSASTVGVQPVVLDQNFVKVGTGQTPAFSNNGTPANTVDDKQGVYALTGAEKVTVTAAPKAGETALPANAQSLLNAIKSATTLSAWVTAVTTAKAAMDVNFSVNLGDSVDITGDGMPDKSSVASLVYAAPGANDSQVTLTANAGAATTGGAFQPVVLTQSFVKVGTGQTSAYANNGTPTNMSDDKNGVYTLMGTESVTVNAGVKQGTTTMPTNAQLLLNAIKAATTVAEFDSAVNAAKAVMDVNFGVNLGDGVDITGDNLPDKGAGAGLVYNAPATGASQITLSSSMANTTGGLQSVILTQSFVNVMAGQGFAVSNNGTPTVTSDDKLGSFLLTGSEKVYVSAAIKSGSAVSSADAQALLDNLSSATTIGALNKAITDASAALDMKFGVYLGDNSDITKDGQNDKGSVVGLLLKPLGETSTQAVFVPKVSDTVPLAATGLTIPVGTSTLAFANNGTPLNSTDDVTGWYTVAATDQVGVAVRIKGGNNDNSINYAQYLQAIQTASNVTALNAAVAAASPYLEVVFGVDVGDAASINGDTTPEKGTLAKLNYSSNGTLTPAMEFPLMGLGSKTFLKAGTGLGSAFSLGNFAFGTDDKSGGYRTTAQDASALKLNVQVVDAVDATTFSTLKGLVSNIKNATTLTDFATAVTNASNNPHLKLMFLNYIGDGKDITGDGVPDWNAYALLTMQGGTTTNGVFELQPMVDAPTVLPRWITSAAYGTQSTTTTDLMSPQAAISSLLINDGDSASWLAKTDGNAARPTGASLNGAPLLLSYAFQTTGAPYLDGQNVAHTINGSFSDGAKSFMRSVFSYFSQVANIKFTESTSQVSADNNGGGADIRIFTDTALALDSQTSTLGFAYQPTSNDPKTSDRDGNFFMVSDAQGLSGTPFQRPYDDAKNTVVHELGHSLGLDHPFADTAGSPGFDWYGSSVTGGNDNTVYPNHLGVQTGGGHDTPATDYMLETIMTYQNPYKGVEPNLAGVTSSTNTPWKLGVYDIAALQHLYGANMAYNIGNDTYTYSSDQVVFDTIWDAGGSGDTISQTGDRPALIDLRGGDHFSRVGLFGGAEYDFSKPDIEASVGKTMTGMKVQYQLDNGTFVDTGVLTTPTDTSWHWISDPLIPFGKMATATLAFSDGAKMTLPIPAAVPDPSMAYNLGIAFGVVIEQASGGNGDDVLVGNSANNTLIGNGGRDTFVYFASTTYNNGTDVIKDFQDGLDAIEIVQSQEGLSGLAASMTANDANKYFVAVQSGSDTKVTLFAGDGQTTVGTVYLSNFQASNLTYTDFKVI